jgi:oligoribonuclease NrnB/cAMP/cGMP phosphodiesterase (DHH superfamily)
MPVIFHHNDADGRLSAAIAYSVIPEAKLFEVGYKSEIPFNEIEKDDVVIILDFSFQKDGDWKKLFEITKHVVWIDHHKTAIEKFKKEFAWLGDIKGSRKLDKSGAYQAWEFFYTGKKIPYVVNLVDKWDTWTHNGDSDVVDFIRGLEIQDCSPESMLWKSLLFGKGDGPANLFKEINLHGKAISKYFDKISKDQLEHNSYEVVFEGYKCLVCNTAQLRGGFFDSKPGYDVYISYVYNGRSFQFRIESKKIDVSEIAKKYGGGGHAGASGFSCEELPWGE